LRADLPGDRDDRGGRDHPPRHRLRALPLAVRRPGRPAGRHPSSCRTSTRSATVATRCGPQSFGGYDLFIIIIGWVIVALTVAAGVVAHAQAPGVRVLKSIREDEDGRPQPWQERLLLQMQSLVVGRHHRGPRRHGESPSATGPPSPANYSTTLTFFSPSTILILGGVARVKARSSAAMIFLVHDHVRRQTSWPRRCAPTPSRAGGAGSTSPTPTSGR